jgi:hypothetical protein
MAKNLTNFTDGAASIKKDVRGILRKITSKENRKPQDNDLRRGMGRERRALWRVGYVEANAAIVKWKP